MRHATDFSICRRTDGSIDTAFYRERAERLHNASFAAVAKRVLQRINSTWQAPNAFWLASRR